MSSSPTSTQGPLRQRSSSNQERIDNILETARRRSIAMANDGASLNRQSPPTPARSFNPAHIQIPETLPESSSKKVVPRALEGIFTETESSSADEETAIVGRERQRRRNSNYLGTAATPSLRARHNSQTSMGRASQITSVAEVAGPQAKAVAKDSNDSNSQSWWENKFAKFRSMELENKGSVARDHLALERTFLAWLRTSLGFASIGIAITQLFRLNGALGVSPSPSPHLHQLGKPLGATFLGISIVVLFIGFNRYFEGQHWLIKGKFPASRGSIALVALIAFILMVVSLVVVLIIEPGQFEK